MQRLIGRTEPSVSEYSKVARVARGGWDEAGQTDRDRPSRALKGQEEVGFGF